MYQSLLPILQPLISDKKSGILYVTHRYNDQAQIFLRDGNIEEIKTKNYQGKNAAITCLRWVSITTRFQEGGDEKYTPDPEIKTDEFLASLKKVHRTIEIISEKIVDDKAVFQFDSRKLKNSSKLNANAFKTILLLDGKRSVAQIISISGKPELSVLTQICRAVMDGIAARAELHNSPVMKDGKKFLEDLGAKLIDLVGPAGSALVNDALEKTGISVHSLDQDNIFLVLEAINAFLEEEDEDELEDWVKAYIAEFLL